jgi:hypothetical protein
MKVEKPGEWAGMFNPTTKELFVHAWDTNKDVGKKCCYATAFTRTQRRRGENDLATGRHIIPGYDHYKAMFSLCDHFNRALHDRKWPHKSGGRYMPGDLGHQHNFALSCLLQNVFNAYLDVCDIDVTTYEFKTFALRLADEIMEFSLTLP